jgi:threonine/homoserine/homoserine lactone efflux protein
VPDPSIDGMVAPDPSTLSLFVSAALVLLLTPGPAVIYIVTRSVEQGRRAGAAYLVYLGSRMLVGRTVPHERGAGPSSNARQIFSQASGSCSSWWPR